MRILFPLPLCRLALLLAALPPLASCHSVSVVKANAVPAIQATGPVPEEQLLDIGILPFDPGIPEDQEELEKSLIVPDVRRAESGFIAYHLKDTLELTGHWGAVRVTPAPSNAVELQISGAILYSDGEALAVRAQAHDATGRLWLDEVYEDVASRFNYESPTEDPFQDVYNRLANDLLAARQKQGRDQLVNIKQVAGLKFARDLAPDAFGGYLKEKRGKLSLAQLPAQDDSTMARVALIKEQEYLLVDTLDDHYSRFYREVTPSYNAWREATYDESIRYQEARRQARNRIIGGALMMIGGLAAGRESDNWAEHAATTSAVTGGVRLITSGVMMKKSAEVHLNALKELSQSLGGEIAEYALDIEGRTIELKGTAAQQYAQWRGLLKRIYAAEAGLAEPAP